MVDAGLAAVSPARGHALRLLIAFIGGVLGSAYALQRFVDAAFAVSVGMGATSVSPLAVCIQHVVVTTRVQCCPIP
jgi:hypothetical protein